jgi:3-deoxy-7-phosphoheptulonate synthase
MERLIRLRHDAPVGQLQAQLQGLGLWVQPLQGDGGRVVGFQELPHSTPVATAALRRLDGVDDVLEPASPHPLLDAQAGKPVRVAPRVRLGGGAAPVWMAGPCCVESEAQVRTAAAAVAEAGGRLLRGGAWKPRTSPYAFQGHGAEALRWLRQAADAHGLGVVTEVLGEADVEVVAAVADLVQIGSRNMQNFALLRAVGQTGRPVLLKRGRSATLAEWRAAAEHLLRAGAEGVVFCERGIAGIDPETRNTLDLGAVAVLKHAYGLPVVVDPSHAAGRRDLIAPLAKAALGAGADGLLVECHPDPATARSDGPQALTLDALHRLIDATCADDAVPRAPQPPMVIP